MKTWLAGVLMMAASLPTFAAVKGEAVEYNADGVTLKGYLAYDDAKKEQRPAVLVVHEWWGHNAYARKRADMLAEMGYTALAVDMYGDGKTADHPKDAGAFAGEVLKNKELAKKRFLAAMDLLKQNSTVQKESLAAIGYCFGGATVLNMARMGLDLKGVASFHGMLSTKEPAKAGEIKAKIMVFNGEADAMIPEEQVEAFKSEMKAAKADFEYVGYPNVQHSFTNPDADGVAQKFSLPLAYDKEADQDSWKKLDNFLKHIFNSSPERGVRG
jgi:dienelactone hydrolase